MSQFEIYTYQFQRILKCSQTEIKFDGMPSVACTDEQWNDRQGLFGKFFDSNVNLEFRGDKGILLYGVVYNQDNIIIMRLANEKKKNVDGKDFKPKSITEYPWCWIVFDNRNGIQRMLIGKNSKAWKKTHVTANIVYRTFDKLMLQYGMHFSAGERPVYHKQEFWDAIKESPQGVNRILFKFPPTNLGRLLNLADNIDAVRHETGGGVNVDLIAPKDGILNLIKENSQTDSMAELGSAAGHEIKIWRKGVRTPKVIGNDSVIIEIPENLLNRLCASELFPDDVKEKFITELNNIKTSYA